MNRRTLSKARVNGGQSHLLNTIRSNNVVRQVSQFIPALSVNPAALPVGAESSDDENGSPEEMNSHFPTRRHGSEPESLSGSHHQCTLQGKLNKKMKRRRQQRQSASRILAPRNKAYLSAEYN